MENRCRRCNRKLKNEEAVYGWRCAEILGVSEFMSLVDYDTFARFTEGIMYADKLYKNSNLVLSESQMHELYKNTAKMFLWDGIDDNEAKKAKQKTYSIVNGYTSKSDDLSKTLDDYWKRFSVKNKAEKDTAVQNFNSISKEMKASLNKAKELLSAIPGEATKAWKSFVKELDSIAGDIEASFNEAKKQLSAIPEQAEKLWAGLEKDINSFLSEAEKALNDAKDQFGSIPQKAKDMFDNLKNDIDSFREDVQKTAIEGAKSIADDVSQKMAKEGVLDDISVDALKLIDKAKGADKVIDENGNLIENSSNKTGVENYKFNKSIDMSGYKGFINGQGVGNVAKLKFGTRNMNYNGCEIIATYNALLELDDRVDICDIAAHYESDGQMLGGEFGTNPYAAKRYFENRGYSVETVEGDDITSGKIPDSDVYILSYWNSSRVSGALHTVAIRKKNDGKVEIFNEKNMKNGSSDADSILDYAYNNDRQPIVLLAIRKNN